MLLQTDDACRGLPGPDKSEVTRSPGWPRPCIQKEEALGNCTKEYRDEGLVRRGLYAYQLEHWLKHFDAKQFLILNHEEVRSKILHILDKPWLPPPNAHLCCIRGSPGRRIPPPHTHHTLTTTFVTNTFLQLRYEPEHVFLTSPTCTTSLPMQLQREPELVLDRVITFLGHDSQAKRPPMVRSGHCPCIFQSTGWHQTYLPAWPGFIIIYQYYHQHAHMATCFREKTQTTKSANLEMWSTRPSAPRMPAAGPCPSATATPWWTTQRAWSSCTPTMHEPTRTCTRCSGPWGRRPGGRAHSPRHTRRGKSSHIGIGQFGNWKSFGRLYR